MSRSARVSLKDDYASDLVALYVHDDRHGPYLRATVIMEGDQFHLDIDTRGTHERWRVTYILIPVHSKIRLSFAGLRQCAMDAMKIVHAHREAYLGTGSFSGG